MATKAGDDHDSSTDDIADHGSLTSPDHGSAPITTPDSDRHSAPDPEYVPDTTAQTGDIAHTRTAALWTGLVVGAVVLIVLLVFIVQNLDSVAVQIFVWQIDLPLGISMLLAAIAGALVMALVGGFRILQVRRAAKH